jgi:hypothetical protein
VVLRKTSDPAIGGIWTLGGGNGNRYPQDDGRIYDTFATLSWDGGPAAGVDITGFHFYDVGGDANLWLQKLNGKTIFSREGNTVSFNGNPVLGDGGSGYFDGDIAEVIIFDRVLGDAERDAIGQYLTQKYHPSTVPVPDKPALTAYAVSGTQADLAWTCPSAANVHTVATIERQADGGSFAAIGTISDASGYTDTGLTASQTYTYRLSLSSYAGTSPYSDPVTVTTLSAAALPAMGLRLWLRSTAGVAANSNGYVSVWADQSGVGNDAVQSNASQQPSVVANQLDGLPVVHFTRSNSTLLNLPDLMSGAAGGEGFAVVRRSATTNVVGLWAFGSSHGSRYPESNTAVFDDFATTSWRSTGPAPAGLTAFNLYNVGGDATVWFQNFNGQSHFRGTTNTVGFRSNPTIGDGQDCSFDGDIAEAIVYDRVLTDAERLQVNDYLSRKYPMGWGVGDAAPPTAPTGLATSGISATSITLRWNASTDDVAVAGYLIYRDGVLIGSTSATSFNVTGLTTGVTYSLTVRAMDSSGKISEMGDPVAVAPLPPWPWSSNADGDSDGDGIPNNQDAQPNNPAIGRLQITITTPANGAVIP